MTSPSAPVQDDPLPQARVDAIPLFLIAAIMLGAFFTIGSGSTWLTLTIAGLAMGLLIFIMASGLTLVFGLMDVMNFAHGLIIAIGLCTQPVPRLPTVPEGQKAVCKAATA